jgi:hypothetical protein
MAYSSFFAQLVTLNEPDPAPISSAKVAYIKGVGLASAILALVGSLKAQKEEN